MLRRDYRQLAIVCVLAGIVLRALTPLGYMPSSLDSGYLFELCPEQLPAGFLVAKVAPGHQHHHDHGSSSSDSPATTPDQCQIGHLLFSAIAADTPTLDLPEAAAQDKFVPAADKELRRTTLTAYRTRAPPA
jgi:hypothetical protein